MKILALLVQAVLLASRANAAMGLPAENPWEKEYDLGTKAIHDGNLPEARARLHGAASAVEALPADAPQRSLVYHELGFVEQSLGRLDLAGSLFERAIGVWEKQPRNDVVSRDGLAAALNMLASVRLEQGRWREAESAARRALPIFLKDYGEANLHTVHCMNTLAEIRISQELYADAEAILLDLIPKERQIPEVGSELISSVSSLGRLYLISGRIKESEGPLQEAFAGALERNGGYLLKAETTNDLGTLYRLEGDLARAEPLLRKAKSLYESFLPGNAGLSTTLAQIAALEMAENKFALAEQDLQSAVDIVGKTVGSDRLAMAQLQSSLSFACFHQGKYSRAQALLESAVALADNASAKPNVTVARFHANLAEVFVHEAKRSEAAREYRLAISLFEQAAPGGDPRLRPVLEGYAKVLKADRGRKEEARQLEKRAKSISAMAVR